MRQFVAFFVFFSDGNQCDARIFHSGNGFHKSGIQESFKAKVGALMMKSVFKSLKERMDYQKVGGACFLGVKKIVVKAHGSSTAEAITSSIIMACKLHDKNFIDTISSDIMEAKK